MIYVIIILVIQMKINSFSVTFWFNIFDNHTKFLEQLQIKLIDEYKTFNINTIDNNLIAPIITSYNNKKMTNFSMSKINLQYNMDNVSLEKFIEFKNRVMTIYETLTDFGIKTLHTALFINSEIICDKSLNKITKKILNKKIISEDLVDVTLKFGKKEEEQFYKIITILNKKQIKLPKKLDELGRIVPMPLISWREATIENEIIDISYEINDKYSFDIEKNYFTSEFYLNKMLYLLKTNYESDIIKILEKGDF